MYGVLSCGQVAHLVQRNKERLCWSSGSSRRNGPWELGAAVCLFFVCVAWFG